MSSKPKMTPAELQEAAGRIKVLHKKATEHALEIGRELLRIKAALPHGAFAKWVEKECEFKIRMAQNYMTLARAGASGAEMALLPSTLRVYLSNSTPPAVRQLVNRRLADGEQVSRHDLRAAIVEARQKRANDANAAAPDLLADDSGAYPEINRSRKVAELLMQRLSQNDYEYVMDGMTWGTWNRVLVWLRAKSTAAADQVEAQPTANAVGSSVVPVASQANGTRRASA